MIWVCYSIHSKFKTTFSSAVFVFLSLEVMYLIFACIAESFESSTWKNLARPPPQSILSFLGVTLSLMVYLITELTSTEIFVFYNFLPCLFIEVVISAASAKHHQAVDFL